MASESGQWLSFSVSIRCMAKELLLPVIGHNHMQLGLPFDWRAGGASTSQMKRDLLSIRFAGICSNATLTLRGFAQQR